jgi:large subunit ribosomal protein L10
MAISKAKKQDLNKTYVKRFSDSKASLIADYSGISACELAALRVELRKADSEFKVIKNRVAIKAIEESVPDASPIKDHLKGSIGVAYMYGDVAAGSKALLAFSKTNDKFKVRGGLLDGKLLSKEDVKALSELPSKEELLAKIIGTLVSPHRGLLRVINGVSGNLVRVINAIKYTK